MNWKKNEENNDRKHQVTYTEKSWKSSKSVIDILL